MRFLIYFWVLFQSSIACSENEKTIVNLSFAAERELKQAYIALKNSAEKGDTNSMYELFILVVRNEPYLYDKATEAFNYMAQAGKKGHIESQFSVGSMYQSGYIVEKNIDVALPWLLEAAKNGHAGAQQLAGSNYYGRVESAEGEIKQEYIDKSIYWYEKAMESGSITAIWQLGLLLVTTTTNEQRGKGLIRLAASKGDAKGMYFTAIENKHLWFETKNEKYYYEAVKWYEKAINLGERDGVSELMELKKTNKK